jgi:very-short-patch-repair endonuclease/predicted transcriptional regulator of viral defense system
MPHDGRKTLLPATESIHRWAKGELDRLIVARAARQHGVIALAQLLGLGLSSAGVRTRVAAGRLHRIHQGVYAVGRPDLAIEGRWMAAVLACGDGAVLSHRSAGTLHGLLNARAGRIHVTVPRRTTVARTGIRVHRCTCLAPEDRTLVDGIACTSVPATLLGIAATAPRSILDSACNRAEMEGVLDMRAVGELLERRRSHPGATRLRAALEVDGLGRDRTKSRLERSFLLLARATGLPEPAVNAWMPIPGEEVQCDFVWHRERVVVEVDGWVTHGTRRAFRDDRRRDRVLRTHGWTAVRVTGYDIEHEPDEVVKQVRALLAGADPPVPMPG